MNKCLISVITVNYNNHEGLERTIASVMAQTYASVEFLIIDGGSSDASPDIIKKYEEHLDYWVSEKDNGVYHAMNKGIVKAKGEYLFFLNSGDEFYGERVLEEMIQGSADIIYGDVMYINRGKPVLHKYPGQLRASFLFYTTICHQALLVKKSCFEYTGLYDESLSIVSDWKFILLALCRFNLSYEHRPVTVANFYLGGISSSRENIPKLIKEREDVLTKEFPMFSEDYKLHNKLRLAKYRLKYLNPVNVLKRILELIQK